MLKKEITYTDYNGVERKEDFYFNLSKAELIEMQATEEGGYAEKIQKAVKNQDVKMVMSIFKDLILRSYGEKSADGKRFVKSEEISRCFEQTEAYTVLFMELIKDDEAAKAFMDGVLPPLTEEEKAAAKKQLEEVNK